MSQHKYYEEDELDEDNFQDSLDRALSSASASSTTVSDDDYNPDPIPKFPKSGSNFDVWINGLLLSVEERRKRLLQELGLSNDRLLSRRNSEHSELGRSVSDDHLCRLGERGHNCQESESFVFRSKSHGPSSACGTNSIISSSIGLIPKKIVTFVDNSNNNNNNDNNSNCNSNICFDSRRNGSSGSGSESPFAFKNTRIFRRTDFGVGECDVDLGVAIKNLDDGKEFVVNEVREDGSWKKVREIETGHQFTMEEFESCVGHSPIVQELMRRQNVEKMERKRDEFVESENVGGEGGVKVKKKGGWFKSVKNVASAVMAHWERRSSDEWDTSSDKVGRRLSSGTEESQNGSVHLPEKVKVRQNGKSWKELTAVYKCQEIQAHGGSIWSIKFSLDGKYLASAGEDCVIHIWQVTKSEKKGDLVVEKSEDGNTNPFVMATGPLDLTLLSLITDNHLEKKKRSKVSISRKLVNLDHVVVPDSVFALSETPVCSFRGHLDDVLDLSWSKSQYLLSSSMDKTVRLWHMDSYSCLKTFSHSDYVTCIQFNPTDDRYFISGSLDAKVRIWSIPHRQVVDWHDLHEMVTAASYTPDGQGALVGSYKGSCRMFSTSENKLQQKSQIDLQNKRKKSHLKKITGFQFAPGRSAEVLITSADSRIRVAHGTDLVHKFKGFRNTTSQMSASLTANGKHVVCASEDSHVYVWKHEGNSGRSKNKGVSITHSYEHFHSPDVSVAIPWPVLDGTHGIQDNYSRQHSRLRDGDLSTVNHNPPVEESNQNQRSASLYGVTDTVSNVNNSYFFDRFSVTWPEEKLPVASENQIPRGSFNLSNGIVRDRTALGMVIVTASLKGEIKIYQNFGLPIRV